MNGVASMMPQAFSPPARTSVLIVDGDASLRQAVSEASGGHDPIEALRRVLTSRGYDVVVSSCPEEAQRLAQERSFDRIYSDGTLPLGTAPRVQEVFSGPKIEDLGDGKARVKFDQALSWSVAVELLDILSDSSPEEPQHLS